MLVPFVASEQGTHLFDWILLRRSANVREWLIVQGGIRREANIVINTVMFPPSSPDSIDRDICLDGSSSERCAYRSTGSGRDLLRSDSNQRRIPTSVR